MSAPHSASASAPVPAPRGGWFAIIVIGSLLAMLGGSLLGAAGVAGAVIAHSENGVLTSSSARVSTPAYAVTSPAIDLDAGRDADDWPEVGVTMAAGTEGGAPVFIGVGPAADVADYLAGVHVAEVTGLRGGPLELQTRDVPGSAQPESPESQDFWVASDSGSGMRELDWQVQPGSWTVVVMNADGSPGIATTVAVGVDAPWVVPIAVALISVAAGLLLIGVVLILVGVFGWGRGQPITTVAPAGHYPVAVTGELRTIPSRGLWLVKWLLLLPHWIVLGVLSLPFVLATIVAGFAILFTGRYPRALFAFTVGVLRWTWRAAFYGYSALATDQYPPFSLQRTDYPADFDVAYPERLSRGLVLVKSWLLALPHLLVVGALTGGAAWGMGWMSHPWTFPGAGIGLLGLLVLVTAVALLFSGRYLVPLFDFVMGINRWALRVAAYVSLMRDEYPPFRLDQGATEPTAAAVAVPSADAKNG